MNNSKMQSVNVKAEAHTKGFSAALILRIPRIFKPIVQPDAKYQQQPDDFIDPDELELFADENCRGYSCGYWQSLYEPRLSPIPNPTPRSRIVIDLSYDSY